MDNSTCEVRLANWQSIVEQCASRPEGKKHIPITLWILLSLYLKLNNIFRENKKINYGYFGKDQIESYIILSIKEGCNDGIRTVY